MGAAKATDIIIEEVRYEFEDHRYRMPIKFGGGAADMTRPAPLFGQHTREVLDALGYTGDEIAAFARAGTIVLG